MEVVFACHVTLPAGTASACTGVNGPSDGITTAAFRIDGWPAGLMATSTTFNPASSAVVGDPRQNGVIIGFPSCFTAPSGPELLCKIDYISTAVIPPTTLTVVANSPPTNPLCPCPLVALCDTPIHSQVCTATGSAYINVVIFGDGCTVAVQPSTWSRVKSLYE